MEKNTFTSLTKLKFLKLNGLARFEITEYRGRKKEVIVGIIKDWVFLKKEKLFFFFKKIFFNFTLKFLKKDQEIEFSLRNFLIT